MTYPSSNALAQPDARIDQILTALRTTEAPAGLEERIAARLQRAAEERQSCTAQPRTLARTSKARAVNARTVAASFFAVILNAVKDPRILFSETPLYASATAACILALTLASLAFLSQHHPNVTPQVAQGFNREAPSAATNQVPQLSGRETPTAAANQVPQGFSLTSHSAPKTARVSTHISLQQPDPDAIALAETLAPSRAAPPLPLTPQEQLIVSATRPGQPIQLAEMDIAREPFLRAAAKARTDAAIQRYVHGLLAPFAVADALQPTTVAEPREISTAAPAPQPQASLSN